MFEQLKAEYDAWVKGKHINTVQAGVVQTVLLCCSRSTTTRDNYHSARWHREEGDELADKSHGYRQGDFERSFGANCHRKGQRRTLGSRTAA